MKLINSMTPEERAALDNYRKIIVDTNANDFGAATRGNEHALGRRVAVIPADIYAKMKQAEPETFRDKKKLIKFLNTYSIFKAADKL